MIIFAHAILYLNTMKTLFLKINCDEKWVLYNKVGRKRFGASEMNHHQQFKDDVVYIMGTGKESSIMNSFWKMK